MMNEKKTIRKIKMNGFTAALHKRGDVLQRVTVGSVTIAEFTAERPAGPAWKHSLDRGLVMSYIAYLQQKDAL
jgi:hypothetical protein